MLLAEQGNYDDAIDHLKEALRLNPNQILAHNKLALILYETGRFDEAVKHWRVSLRLKPDQPEIKDRIAAALAQKQKKRLE
jgi:Flp pilus assembly protein TadD